MIPTEPLRTLDRCIAELARRVPARPACEEANIAAVAHCVRGETDLAIACLERSLALDFNQFAFQALLAELLLRTGRWETYARRGEFGLEIVAALEGIATPPARYHPLLVGKLFDRLSAEYEERVMGEGYAEHTRVAEALSGLPRAGRPLRILDLGCGTGMLGEALHAAGVDATLVGVDMSEAMLAQARSRAMYESLHRDDIERFLREGPRDGAFDAAALASVIPFFGDLGSILRAIADYSYDVTDAEGVQFNEHGRFRHAPSHVAEGLERSGLSIESREPFVARKERGEPVRAELVVAQKA
jgi:predicted TPR repeat methyltransferase